MADIFRLATQRNVCQVMLHVRTYYGNGGVAGQDTMLAGYRIDGAPVAAVAPVSFGLRELRDVLFAQRRAMHPAASTVLHRHVGGQERFF